jgi:hypothetical protein
VNDSNVNVGAFVPSSKLFSETWMSAWTKHVGVSACSWWNSLSVKEIRAVLQAE